ncbi:MAG: chloride channel protein [Alphaproteobacteria bacterium]|nr:chloride channel protein [Alphaproteobacteria bacterium]
MVFDYKNKFKLSQKHKNDEIQLIYVLKWLVLSMFAGAFTGALIRLFLWSLEIGIKYVKSLPDWRYLLIPFGLFIAYYTIKLFAPEAAGHGTDKVISAIHYRASRISAKVVPAKIFTTFITLSTGGVVGTEGPSVQIGSGFMSWIALLFKLSAHERKKFVICGASAALAAVFGDPIAGAIFGVEVLFVGEFFYPMLLQAISSGVVSWLVCTKLGMVYPKASIVIPSFNYTTLFITIFASIFFTFVCMFHIKCVEKIGELAKSWNVAQPIKTMIAAVALIFSGYYFGDDILRTGEEGLFSILNGNACPWYYFALKSFLLAITLAGGGSGGVLTPTFFIGASAGCLFAQIFGLDIGLYSALGFIACVAGAVNTPMAAIFLGIGMFGAPIAPYAAIVCLITYVLVGPRSLYSTQILVRPKSDAFVLAEPNNTHSWNYKPRKFRNKFMKKRHFKTNKNNQ